MLKVVEAPGKARPAYLEIRRVRDAVVVSFKLAFEHDAILRLREREIWRRTRRVLRHVGEPFVRVEGSAVELSGLNGSAALIHDLERTVQKIALRPLTPAMVQEILGISSRERIRWAKDGRLAPTAIIEVTRGQSFRFGTYAVADVRRLLDDPTIVAAWRKADEIVQG
jgi:hypothetical protein